MSPSLINALLSILASLEPVLAQELLKLIQSALPKP